MSSAVAELIGSSTISITSSQLMPTVILPNLAENLMAKTIIIVLANLKQKNRIFCFLLSVKTLKYETLRESNCLRLLLNEFFSYNSVNLKYCK